MYVAYNRSKNEKMSFKSYRDIVVVGCEFGKKLRNLLMFDWQGDQVAIFNEDAYFECNAPDLPTAKEVVVDHYRTEKFYSCGGNYIITNTGSVFDIQPGPVVRRLDSLIMLLSLDMPSTYTTNIYRGYWAYKYIIASSGDEEEFSGQNISYLWQAQEDRLAMSDEDIIDIIAEYNIEIPEYGMDPTEFLLSLEGTGFYHEPTEEEKEQYELRNDLILKLKKDLDVMDNMDPEKVRGLDILKVLKENKCRLGAEECKELLSSSDLVHRVVSLSSSGVHARHYENLISSSLRVATENLVK